MSFSNGVRAAVGAATVAAALLGAAAPASAELRTVTVRQGPVTVGPYQVRYASKSTKSVAAPGLEGYLVRMSARVIDKTGQSLPVKRLMLHHIVYKNLGPLPR